MQHRKPLIIISSVLIACPAGADVTFAPPVSIDTPGATADIRVLDLNDDGHLDIAALEAEFDFVAGTAVGMLNVLLNDGAGGFPTLATFELATVGSFEFAYQILVPADLDDDGDPDLAAIGTLAPLMLAFNDGAGGFGPAIDTGITVSFNHLRAMMDAGDFEGDGDVDLAIGLPGQLATNDGSGGFAASQFSSDLGPNNVEVVDLDLDGDDDIAYGYRVHLNDGTGVFTQQEGSYPGGGAFECVFADFDGDADPDVACADYYASQLSIALNDGDAVFDTPVAIAAVAPPRDLHLGRFDGDTHLDLLMTYLVGSDIIGVFTGHGDGSFDDAVNLPAPSGSIAAAGDFNGDGLDDVVMSTASAFTTGPIAVLLNTGVPVVPGDLDGDGVVGIADFLALLAAWGPCPPAGGCPGDLDGDGRVGITDFLTLLANWT